jgi:hypothetical protein
MPSACSFVAVHGRNLASLSGMLLKCEVCEIEEPRTGLILVGANGAKRIAVCANCQSKAKSRDPEVWETIHEILRRPGLGIPDISLQMTRNATTAKS